MLPLGCACFHCNSCVIFGTQNGVNLGMAYASGRLTALRQINMCCALPYTCIRVLFTRMEINMYEHIIIEIKNKFIPFTRDTPCHCGMCNVSKCMQKTIEIVIQTCTSCMFIRQNAHNSYMTIINNIGPISHLWLKSDLDRVYT